MNLVCAYIGLGSNLADPAAQLTQALASLAQLPDTQLQACSPRYLSAPLGPPGQPDYLNAVAAVVTKLTPLDLLDALQMIEHAQGRVRNERWGARTLDLDILLYGDQCIELARLQIPHPQIAVRNFVLYPLADLALHLEIPGLGPLPQLLARCPPTGLQRLD